MKTVVAVIIFLFSNFLGFSKELNVVYRIFLNTRPSATQQNKMVEAIEKLAGVKQVNANGSVVCVDATKSVTIESLKSVIVNEGFWIENYVDYSGIDVTCSKIE